MQKEYDRFEGSILEFAKHLKKLRENRKLSIRQTAKLVGVPESTYRDWEYGNAIQGEPYPQIAKAFGITLNELFGVTDDESVDAQLDKIIAITHTVKSKLSL